MSNKMDQYEQQYQDRVYTLKLDMLYSNIQDHGINPEYCWDLMKIAQEMLDEGYGSYVLIVKLNNFKENFAAHGAYYDIWYPLWAECKASIPENVHIP